LCARPLPGTKRCVLGRETAMQEVEWREDGWLYLKKGGNHPYDTVEIELTEEKINTNINEKRKNITYHFTDDAFLKYFQTLRIPYDSKYMSLDARKGYLRLTGRESIYSRFYQTLLARRQEDFCFCASTEMEFDPTSFGHMAGLIYRYDENNQYYLYITYEEEKNYKVLQAIGVRGGEYEVMAQTDIKGDTFRLGISVKETKAQFLYWQDEKWNLFGTEFDITNLSDDFTYGFTGAFVGICVQDLCDQTTYADFKWFRYTNGE